MPYLGDSCDCVNLFREGEITKEPVQNKTGTSMMSENSWSLTSNPVLEQQQENRGMTCLEDVRGDAIGEVNGEDAMEGVEHTSRPPSPPTGNVTPVLRIQQCPLRLRSLIPPPNYGATKSGAVFRSAYPQDRNIEFLKGLDVQTVLCLVATEPSATYSQWIRHSEIKRLRIDIAPNKEGKINTTWDSLCEALLVVMDCTNYPLYVHCNQGRHRTGCVIACLRKIQRVPIEDIIAEYRAYANPKARPGDIDLIRAFDPECVFEYAKTHGLLENQPFMKRMDSAIANIDALAEALSSRDADEMTHISGLSSNASMFSDDGLEMTHGIDPRLQNGSEGGDSMDNGVVEFVDGSSERDQYGTDASMTEAAEGFSSSADSNDSEEGLQDNDSNTTTTVVELAEEAMTPPAVVTANPFV